MLLLSLSLVTLTSTAALFGGKVAPTQRSGSAYSYAARSLVDNSVQELEQYRGRVSLFVNVRCL